MRWLPEALLSMILLAGCSANSVEDQAKQLGVRDFTVQAWTAGTQEERGQMVASFLAKYRVTDLTGKQLRALLGPSTGYYDYDEYPAYLVGPKTVKSDYGNGYLWVFITDKSSGEVRKVILVPAVKNKRR